MTEAGNVSAAEEPQFDSQRHLHRSHTGWHVYAVAFCVGAVVFGAGILLDWWLLPGHRPVLYSDGFTAVVSAVLAFIALRHYDKRRQEVLVRLAIIADVNHHVRNAITAVMLKVHLTNEPELKEITDLAVKRIDWVLRDVLPRDVTKR